MTAYYKVTDGNYISGFGTNGSDSVTAISEQEYGELMTIFNNRPKDPDGYQHLLRAETLEWELTELPEPEDDDAQAQDYEDALGRLGVDV